MSFSQPNCKGLLGGGSTQKITNKKNPYQMVSELDVVGGL
jgi:hypothetical protein